MLLMPGATVRAVRERVAQRGLPPEVAALILRVVRRTRLRRNEQMDIAAELASHFAEGLARGADPEALMRDFGDVRATARRIRHGAIAKRSPADRAMRLALRGIGAFVVAIAAAYVLAAAWLSTRTPTISFDALADAQAKMPVPGPEGSAVSTYLRALAGPDGSESLTKGDAEKEWVAVTTLLPRVSFDPAAEARVRRWLDANKDRLAALRELEDRPVLGVPLVMPDTDEMRRLMGLLGISHVAYAERWWSDAGTDPQGSPKGQNPPYLANVMSSPLLGVGLPCLVMIRDSAQCMSVDAAIAARDGDTVRFMECIRAMDSMSRHAREPAFIVGALVSSSVRAQMASTIVSAIENYGPAFSDVQLGELHTALASADDGICRGLEGERLMLHDVIQRCYTDDGAGSGMAIAGTLDALATAETPWNRSTEGDESITPDLLRLAVAPLLSFGTASRREVQQSVDRMYDALLAACQSESFEDARTAALAYNRELTSINRLRNPVQAILMPAIGSVILQRWQLRRTCEIACAAVGIEQFRRAHGRFPDSLDELRAFAGSDLGGWLEGVAPWQYAIVDGRPLIWDPGYDGHDDAARLPRSPRVTEPDIVPDGDTLHILSMDAVPPRLQSTTFNGLREGLPKGTAPDPRESPIFVAGQDPAEQAGTARTIRGDNALVWWGSGATGASRLTLLRTATAREGP